MIQIVLCLLGQGSRVWIVQIFQYRFKGYICGVAHLLEEAKGASFSERQRKQVMPTARQTGVYIPISNGKCDAPACIQSSIPSGVAKQLMTGPAPSTGIYTAQTGNGKKNIILFCTVVMVIHLPSQVHSVSNMFVDSIEYRDMYSKVAFQVELPKN
ncbi:hypothetical protein CEXT_1291 [Caerostris extrusa]|uniref:Uncharacterized protein n=1 Tax=Caerostris extrusa TaxID=172846 RepID=A0AAV4SIS6_CAEEX|nr:hypothetical protein CEXT_1291 [Caerostris extrusa]